MHNRYHGLSWAAGLVVAALLSGCQGAQNAPISQATAPTAAPPSPASAPTAARPATLPQLRPQRPRRPSAFAL